VPLFALGFYFIFKIESGLCFFVKVTVNDIFGLFLSRYKMCQITLYHDCFQLTDLSRQRQRNCDVQ
jgi:hypothetical protein